MKKDRKALKQVEAAELKKKTIKIATYIKGWKQIYRELKVYLKPWLALAKLLK